MNTLQLARDAIARVAPDVDVDALPIDVDFREEADLDSMDFLAVLNAIRDRTGVEVAESDYPRIITLQALADYVEQHLRADR
jgi:acyl carrier protein